MVATVAAKHNNSLSQHPEGSSSNRSQRRIHPVFPLICHLERLRVGGRGGVVDVRDLPLLLLRHRLHGAARQVLRRLQVQQDRLGVIRHHPHG